jgi:predicted amidophosphoribosyltransferase
MGKVQHWCNSCQDNKPAAYREVNHVLHLLLTALMCGLWLPVWAFVAMTHAPRFICTSCGKDAPDRPRQIETVACPFCLEQIKAAARVCSHCQRDVQ